MKNENEVWTIDEVAEFLRIKPETVRRLAKAGEIPARKLGGNWRFLKSEIINYMWGDD